MPHRRERRVSEPKATGPCRSQDGWSRKKASRDASADEVDRRIAALKAKEAHAQATPERFRFVLGEPYASRSRRTGRRSRIYSRFNNDIERYVSSKKILNARLEFDYKRRIPAH